VFRRKAVIVSDVLTDPLWEDYRDLAITFDFRSCWSIPIFSHTGELFGTFALYSRVVRLPTTAELQLIDMATRFAGIALERQKAEEHISHMAHHDALTGLPNRILLKERLKQAMVFADRYHRSVIVAFVDLDNFKLINDTLSHSAGDEVLKIIAQRMKGCVREIDTVVRLGGDEFVIILFDQSDDTKAIAPMLNTLHETIEQAIYVGTTKLEITYSMGLARYPADGMDLDEILMNADVAMYRAKAMGRNNYQFYS
jgi:diguanylate cyclase (GGDEF)-like protein